MPTIEENSKYWSSYSWPKEGDEWSEGWGGTPSLWYGTILPRIHSILPADHILEIAPGYGRCTQYLLAHCNRLTVVDLLEQCVESCKRRFASHDHLRYFVNDGRSLDMIDDGSIDFVFSWDSLVHAEGDAVCAYIAQLKKKMRPGGVGFIHHSNLGAFRDPITGNINVENRRWRGKSMSAELFRQSCAENGICCLAQEIVGWGGTVLSDCFSLFLNVAPSSSAVAISENPTFMNEAQSMRRLSEIYCRSTR